MELPFIQSNDAETGNNVIPLVKEQAGVSEYGQPQAKRTKFCSELNTEKEMTTIPRVKSLNLLTETPSVVYLASSTESAIKTDCSLSVGSYEGLSPSCIDKNGIVSQTVAVKFQSFCHMQPENSDTLIHSENNTLSSLSPPTNSVNKAYNTEEEVVNKTQNNDKEVLLNVSDVETNNSIPNISTKKIIHEDCSEHSQLHRVHSQSVKQENILGENQCHNISENVNAKNERTEKSEVMKNSEAPTTNKIPSSVCLQAENYIDSQLPDSQQINKETVNSRRLNDCLDVYDINEHDENSQSVSPLHKSARMLQSKKDVRKCDKTSAVKMSTDSNLHSGLSLRTRVVYMYSDTYVRVCDEMLRVCGRASMVHSLIEAYGLLKYMDLVPPREATHEELLQFHTSDYIQFLEKISQQEDEEKYDEEAEQYGLTYDCPVHVGVYNYAVLVAGATVRAAELLVDGSCDIAMNWGGGWHHAKRDGASGFCYFNDITLGVLKLREKFDRVLYVDLDLHHGDGVEDAFCTTSKVLTVSFHKYMAGFFPGSGALTDVGVSKGRYYTVNVPLLDGIKDAEFYALFNRVMSRVQERFKPEAIVCQCGADGLAGDPMESFNLTPLGLGRCVHTLQSWKIPLLLLGGGGYNFVNTAKCWTFITSLVVGRKLSDDIPDHKFFTEYGPDYELHVSVGNRKDNNSREYLGKLYRQVMANLDNIT